MAFFYPCKLSAIQKAPFLVRVLSLLACQTSVLQYIRIKRRCGSSMMLKILYLFLVFLGSFQRIEGAQILTLPGFWINFP